MDAEFAVSHDKEKLVMQQSRYCMQAAEFFDRSEQVANPAQMLLQIIKEICAYPHANESRQGSEITGYECDALEYLGGYALTRAVTKFGRNPVFELLSAVPKDGSLIKVMEKKAGSLSCPSEELSHLLRHLYLKLGVEFNRKPDQIDLTVLTNSIINGEYFGSFIEKMRWAVCDSSARSVTEIIKFIVTVSIKLLANGFAKKLFQRIRSNCLLSRGLRGDLKRQLTKTK